MSKPLSRNEVSRIAALAQLALTDEEAELFGRHLARILDYAAQIRALDTTGVPPTAHVLQRIGSGRPDEMAESLERDAALANAPDASPDKALFRVPRVIA